MAEIERLTVSLPEDIATLVNGAVETGEFASASDVVQAALRDWTASRTRRIDDLAALRTDIETGLSDIAAGRVQDFDASRIIERGRKLSAARSRSA